MCSKVSEMKDYDNPHHFETGMGPMADKIWNTVLEKLSTSDVKRKLSRIVVDPITDVVKEKAKPYAYAGIFLYLVIVILLVVIIYLLIKKRQVIYIK